MNSNRTQSAVNALLETVLAPFDCSRELGFEDRAGRIHEAAKRVRQAQADDEYASWLEVLRCEAS